MAHLPAPIARIRLAVREFLQRRLGSGQLSDGDLLLVACSGGADSLALAAATAFVAPRMGLRAGLATVDHGMQVGSGEHAAEVAALGEKLGLYPSRVWTAESYEAGFGPEGDARELRYAALTQAAKESGARAVLLAHTMEDQAETVLIGLSRGAGTRAIAGMPSVREIFWRPLLGARREDTEAACEELGLQAWQDPTNAPDGPWQTADGQPLPRAAVRHHVLPALAAALGQDPVPALARTADLAREDSDYLEEVALGHHHLLTDTKTISVGGEARAVWSIDVNDLEALPAALRWRLIRELIVRSGAPPAQVGMTHVYGVDSLITDWRGQHGISLPLGLRARRSYGRLYVVPAPTQENA